MKTQNNKTVINLSKEKEPSTKQRSPRMTRPGHFPCFVIRFHSSCFYEIPIYVIKEVQDLPQKLPDVCRIAVIKDRSEISKIDPVEKILFLAMQNEFRLVGFDCCLVMNKTRCFFMNKPNGEISDSDSIPRTSTWMTDQFYINTLSGLPEERDPKVFEAVRLRIYCHKMNDVKLDILKKANDMGFIPTVIVLSEHKNPDLNLLQKAKCWIKRWL